MPRWYKMADVNDTLHATTGKPFDFGNDLSKYKKVLMIGVTTSAS